MKLPLLVPELREAIAEGNTEELRLICQSGHPSVIAAFISALTPREAWEVLRQAELPLRAEIFSHLEKDVQVDMTEIMKREDLARLLAAIAFGRVLVFSGRSSMPENFSPWTVALAISIALALQVMSSTLIGALLPLGAAKLKFDPAVVASPALTTIVDITGLMIFFLTTKIILQL